MDRRLTTEHTDDGRRGWELLLLSSSLLAALAFGTAAYREHALAPWRSYQRSYRAELLARATDARARKAAERFQVGHRQDYLPGLNRVDRCTTCHVAIEDPAMADAPQPLRAHPGDLLVHHAPGRFGCTICHGGQGRATDAVEAHGHIAKRAVPMRSTEVLQASCAQCHWDEELAGAPVYNLARSLFVEKACLSCHLLRGAGGTIGPDLTAEAGKQTLEWHVEHFLDPQATVPGSQMTNLELTEPEARALAYLMEGFTGAHFGSEYVPGSKPSAGGAGALSADSLGAGIDPGAAEGFVGSQTCLVCHDGLHRAAMDGWKGSPMAHAFGRVRDADDRERCLACHTTGYNPATRKYAEIGVACEACHGPGKEYVPFAMGGKISEHRARALGNVRSGNPCIRCHQPHVPLEKHEETIRALPLPYSHGTSSSNGGEDGR